MDVLAIGDGQVAFTFWHTSDSPKFETEITVPNLKFHATGSAANFAMASARLGLRTALITELGKDENGSYALEQFRKNGVNTRFITFSNREKTSVSTVLVHKNGRRSIVTYLGTQRTFSIKDKPYKEWLKKINPRVVYIGGYFLLPNLKCSEVIELLTYARGKGILTSFDLCWDPDGWTEKTKAEISRISRYIDILFLNEDELRALTGTRAFKESVKALQTNERQIVVVKMGKKGCYVQSIQDIFSSPSFRVKVCDTTGAGDAFNAGFIYGLIRGFSLKETARLANAVAGLEVTVPGPDFHHLGIPEARGQDVR